MNKIEFHAIPEFILSFKSFLDWHASRNNKGNFYFKRKSVVENKLKSAQPRNTQKLETIHPVLMSDLRCISVLIKYTRLIQIG